ncbi:MAG: AAA family ATPase, partial [Planctomycetaceae bacterium]|nr:AAA family ATPase [Planctomycetaceae bacterium]
MIRRIRIQNFKSLRDVTVELSPVTVFVGRSGTGKSNFVTALKFLRDQLRSGGQGHLTEYGDASSMFPLTQPKSAIRYEIEFEVPGYEEPFQYQLCFHAERVSGSPQLESLKYGSQIIFSQESAQQNLKPQWKQQPSVMPVPATGNIAIGRLPGLEIVVIAFAALTVGLGVYRFPPHVLCASRPSNGFGGLSDDASNHLSVMKELISNWQMINSKKEINAVLQRVNSTVASIDIDSIQNPQSAIVAHRLGQKTHPLNLAQESDGFRRFYAHLLALYQSPPKQTLVFEEPENGIHPGALALLADEFNAAPDAGRGQVLLTTQSPGLLDHFSTDQIRVVDLVDLETRIGPLDEGQRSAIQDHLLRPGELLTTDPARLQGAS